MGTAYGPIDAEIVTQRTLVALTIIFLNGQFVYFIARFSHVYDKCTTLVFFVRESLFVS